MADRITQLQDLVSQQAILFANVISYINENSFPAEFPKLRKHEFVEIGNKCPELAKIICKTAKEINEIITCLPSDIHTEKLQAKSMQQLVIENNEIANILQGSFIQGERLLVQIQILLQDLAQEVMLINNMGTI
uniref:Mediator of RNA polymerase II transcription subunit 21 n=1 Tax=Clastoptera arizonana TaxID=38151 RepID=A0A1B6CQT5_9HEMI